MLNNTHTNLFDFTRLLASMLVILGHSVFILASTQHEYLGLILGVKAIHASAVSIFFAISGYLITKSYLQNPATYSYLKNRLLRIIPGLVFLCVVSFILLGIFFSDVNFTTYCYSNYKYLFNVVLFPEHYKMQNIFTTNSDANYVNRSLWTLKYEFVMYLIVLLLGQLSVLKNKLAYLILALLLLLRLLIDFSLINNMELLVNIHLLPLIEFGTMFFCGVVFYFIRPLITHTITRVFIAVLISYFLVRFLLPVSLLRFFVLDILLPFLTLLFCCLKIPYLNNTSKYGDFSYGIYLWGYPVQQALASLYQGSIITQNIYLFSLVSIVVTLVFAILSWHLIESFALKFKVK